MLNHPNRQHDYATAAGWQVLDAFYLQGRVLSDTEYAPLREAMRVRPAPTPARSRRTVRARAAGLVRRLGWRAQPRAARLLSPAPATRHQEIVMNRPPLATTCASGLLSVLCAGATFLAIGTLATEAHASTEGGCPTPIAATTKGKAATGAAVAPAGGNRERAKEQAQKVDASASKPAEDPERDLWRHDGVG